MASGRGKNEMTRQVPQPTRRYVLSAMLGCTTALILRSGQLSPIAAAQRSKWRDYDSSVIIDSLCTPGDPNSGDAPLSASDLQDIRSSGLTAVNLTVGGVGSYAHNFQDTIANIGEWNTQIALHADTLMHILCASDIVQAKATKRLGIMYGFQDSTPLGEDLDHIDVFRGLGVRIFQLTYNRRNLVGDGCMESANAGLSTFGNEVVEKLNATHSLVDLSHAGEKTTVDAVRISKGPVAITHTGCAALNPHPRNKTDNELRQVAEKGGYVGIYFMPYLRPSGQHTAEDLLQHLDHAIDVCGEDHVGLGTDGFTSPTLMTEKYKQDFAEQELHRKQLGIAAPGEEADVYPIIPELNAADRFDTFAAMLAKRRYPDARIRKVLGENFYRLLQDVWD